MGIRICKECGKAFDGGKWQYVCPPCLKEIKQKSVIRTRICKECGKEFEGGPRAWYCHSCRTERTRKRDREYKRKNKPERKLGSVDFCKICGKDYIVKSGKQMYCPACAEQAVKEKIITKKIIYSVEYRKKHGRIKATKICCICGKVMQPMTNTVVCSLECKRELKRRWQKKADLKRSPRRFKKKTMESENK